MRAYFEALHFAPEEPELRSPLPAAAITSRRMGDAVGDEALSPTPGPSSAANAHAARRDDHAHFNQPEVAGSADGTEGWLPLDQEWCCEDRR